MKLPVLAIAFILLLAAAAASAQAPHLPDLAGAEEPVAALLHERAAAVTAHPGDAEAWGRYGMALDAHRYYEAAAEAYRHAVEIDAGEFRWTYYLGALLELSDPREAVAWLDRAVDLDGSYPPARLRLARTLEVLGESDRAAREYAEAARQAPSEPAAHLGLGRLALRRGDLRAAVTSLERAYELAPSVQAVAATLARAYHLQGDEERAAELGARARSLSRTLRQYDPRHAEIAAQAVDRESFLRRALTYQETGQLERARQELVKLLSRDPSDAPAQLMLAEVLDRLGQAEPALAAARRALELDPDLAGAQSAVASALVRLQRFDEAERAAAAALAEDPTDVRMHLVRSMAAAQRGDVATLVDHLDRAFALTPTDPDQQAVLSRMLADLAASFAAIGRFDEAVERQEQALEILAAGPAKAAELARLSARLDAYRAGRSD